MKIISKSILFLSLLLFACTNAQSVSGVSWPDSIKEQIGQTYEIRWTQSTKTSRGVGSSGSSNSRLTHIERVIDAGSDEIILEFDMPLDTPEIDRRREWQLPARFQKTPDNEIALLNADELKARNDDWLAWGGLDQSHCGLWIFTWIQQKIEYDPHSVISLLDTIDIRHANLKEGMPYSTPLGLEPVILTQKPSEDGVSELMAVLDLDAEKVRKQRAEGDIVLAQIMGDEVPSIEAALEARKAEKISGSIEVIYTLNSQGSPVRRLRTTQMRVINVDGETESSKTTETVERELLKQP